MPQWSKAFRQQRRTPAEGSDAGRISFTVTGWLPLSLLHTAAAKPMAEHQRTDVEVQLDIALDNMPGALVYIGISISSSATSNRGRCTRPPELLQPGRPYPASPLYLAENGY
jgi:hypothetical protein